MIFFNLRLALLGALAVAPAAAHAVGANTASGTIGGVAWQAQSYIVGQTSTGTIASGGDPRYLASQSAYSGMVGILMDYGSAGAFVCSGTLLSDRQSILTAGHCVSGGAGTANPLTTTVFFRSPTSTGDTYVYPTAGVVDPSVVTRTVSNYFVNPNYTGEVVDQNDIAVLRLSQVAPAFATGYNIYTGSNLAGQTYNIAGYGTRSLVGGAQGTTDTGAGAGVGRARQGLNSYDYRLGDSAFNGFFTSYDPTDPACSPGQNIFCGNATIDYSFVSDFDNGLAANDTAGLLAQSLGLGTQFNNLGLGADEVSSAGGDSGGPQFINGLIASVTSYGLSFGTAYGDYKDGLQSSWGEFNGFVPTFIHRDFIYASMVPEPGTWAMLIVGFGLMGGALRRRAVRTTVSFG